MKARIVGIHPNYVDVGDRDDPSKKVMGTFDVELILVEAKGLTYEEACDYLHDQTDFRLIPVEE